MHGLDARSALIRQGQVFLPLISSLVLWSDAGLRPLFLSSRSLSAVRNKCAIPSTVSHVEPRVTGAVVDNTPANRPLIVD